MEEPETVARRSIRRWVRPPPDDLDDCVQEALIAIWLSGDPNPSHWSTISRHRAIDYLRKTYGRGDRRRYPTDLPIEDRLAITDPTPPLLEVGFTGIHATIAAALVEGVPKADIAAALGVHPSRISQHLRQMRTILKGIQ